jgi:hypothetical protein
LVEHLTFNQGVTGSNPVRPIQLLIFHSFVLLDKFLQSRLQGSSIRTIEFYECCLRPFVLNYELTTDGINQFLRSLTCGNGKHGYYRAIRAFCNWLYRNGYVKSNPVDNVDPPKQSRKLLPCLNEDEVAYLIGQTGNIRDKAIISLFVDSGIRLNELLNIKPDDTDWQSWTITTMGKGSKQRKALFTERTASMLKQLNMENNNEHGNVWGMTRRTL